MGHFSLDAIPIPVVFLGITLLLVAACEAGFLVGRHHHRAHPDQDAHGSIGPMVGGLLAMLGFLLAFAFSMAADQHGNRKHDQLHEAEAIETTYLRADLMSPARGAAVKQLLRDYVDTRLAASHPGADLRAAIRKSGEIQEALWAQVVAEARADSDSNNAQLMVESVNDVITLGETRVSDALRARIPGGVWAGLMLITLLAMVTLGLQVGLTGKRRMVGIVPLCLAFAALFTLVVDLNTPNTGFITVGQQAMQDARARMGQ